MKYTGAIASLIAAVLAAAHAAEDAAPISRHVRGPDGAKGAGQDRRLSSKKSKAGKANSKGKSGKAAGPCNGQGTYFPEESQVLGMYDLAPQCNCFGCYAGDHCEEEMDMATCVIHADDAELPLTTEDGILVAKKIEFSNHYRAIYQPFRNIPTSEEAAMDTNKWILYAMRETLTKLHAEVGNAKTDGYRLVVGLGAHQMLQAANFAHAKLIQEDEEDVHAVTTIYSENGYWSKFPKLAQAFAPSQAWANKEEAEAAEENESLIQLVVSPSNPLNVLAEDQEPLIAPKERQVWDLVYYWPSCFAEKERIVPLEEAVMIFSSSKLAGYAGHRFGWAWVEDDNVADKMEEFIGVTTQAYPAAEMLYNTVILEDILASIGTDNDFFVRVQEELMSRCLEMEAVFEAGGNKYRNLSPCGNMYMQVQCPGDEDDECKPVFDAIGLEVTAGTDDGLLANQVRIAFGYERAWYNKIVEKLEML